MKNTRNLMVAIGMAIVVFATTTLNLNADENPVPSSPPPSTGGGGGGGVPVTPHLAVPDSLPIAELRAYAWDSFAFGSISVWASSAVQSSPDHSSIQFKNPSVGGVTDVKRVLELIKATELALSVLYSSDTLVVGIRLDDQFGNGLFSSRSSGAINPPVLGISRNQLDAVLEMNPKICLPFAAAANFRIIERDENGQVVRTYFSEAGDVRNGHIRFPAYFSRKPGEIIVGLHDGGTEVSYDLGGKKIIPTPVLLGIGNISAFGTRTLENKDEAFYSLVEVSLEEFDRNVNPVVQFVNETREVGFQNQIHLVAHTPLEKGCIWGGDYNQDTGLLCRQPEFASGYSVWLQGQPFTTAQRYEAGPNNFIYLPGGRYWIKFHFPSGWPHGNEFSPPFEGVVEVEEK